MENEISDTLNEINIKKEAMDSPTNNIISTNDGNTSILQNEANTSTSHRPDTSNINQETLEGEKNETDKEINNNETIKSLQEEIQNEEPEYSPQEEIQNEELIPSSQEEIIQNEELIPSPQEEIIQNIQNEEPEQSPQEKIIQNEELIPSPQEEIIQNEELIPSPQEEIIQNEEPVQIAQEEIIQNEESIQLQDEDPVQLLQNQVHNEESVQQPQIEINDQPEIHISPINTNIPQDQSVNGSLNSATSNTSEVLANTWNSISNYLWSWFEPQEGVEGSQVPPLNNSNIDTTKNVVISATTENNNGNNSQKSSESSVEEANTSPLAAGASYYANLIGSFFSRPAAPTAPLNNIPTLTIEKKKSSSSLSASRLNILSQQARMPSIQFIDREEQDGVEPIIDHELTDYIRPHLPLMQRESTKWKLRYSTAQHGISLNTLYQQVQGAGPLLLAIRDTENNVFGAYVSEAFHINTGFYGTRECFLWKYIKGGLKMYPTSGQNEYFILSEYNYIAIGGGNGCYGLYIDEDIQNGQSSECSAFFNEQLSSSIHFQILSLEVWSFEL